jgi:mannose-6-phosphate isomerase-like protein (cupin superfamily)
VFFVLAETMSFLVDTQWIEAAPGSLISVPGNVTHDFENRGSERAGVLNVKMAGNCRNQLAALRTGHGRLDSTAS